MRLSRKKGMTSLIVGASELAPLGFGIPKRLSMLYEIRNIHFQTIHFEGE